MAEFLQDLIGNKGTRVNVMQLPKISLKSITMVILCSFICSCVYAFLWIILTKIFNLRLIDLPRSLRPIDLPYVQFARFILASLITAGVAIAVYRYVIARKKKISASVLVLTAVATGAMLFYIITYTGRGNGAVTICWPGGISLQAQVTEQPADIRSAVTRMILGGANAENITFTGAATANDVFDQGHGGGGATNIPPPAKACSPDCTHWAYLPATRQDSGWYIHGAGTSAADAIAYLPNVTSKTCRAIQKGLGFASSIPPKQAGAPFDPTKPGVYSSQGNAATIKSEDNTLDNQVFACFDNHGSYFNSSFSYYGGLLER